MREEELGIDEWFMDRDHQAGDRPEHVVKAPGGHGVDAVLPVPPVEYHDHVPVDAERVSRSGKALDGVDDLFEHQLRVTSPRGIDPEGRDPHGFTGGGTCCYPVIEGGEERMGVGEG